ncbi:MAG TPA: permease prefix domain 1-containing protein [Candidatus Limnocylindrales bacterium]|nr:permease prefix domain 1-containing protein [Candidatus Limnocylindrales bacterium]
MPETEATLLAHVSSILAGAGVTAAARDDLAEELHGHLVERLRSHLGEGMSEADAAARAIADFGPADSLARAFGRTYHSRLWASTIGVLLPAVVASGERPRVVAWLRFTVAVAAVLLVGGLILNASPATPLRALGTTAADLVGLGALVLAYRALGFGQRWALWYAIAVAVLLLIIGIGEIVSPARPGSVTISLGAVLAGGVLLGVRSAWGRLQAYVSGSRAIGRGLVIALAGSLLLPVVAGPVLAVLPDPTQASLADLTLRLSMTCEGSNVASGGPTATSMQRITLVAEATWRRADFLPLGVSGLFPSSSPQGDSAGFRVPDNEPAGSVVPTWLLANDGPQVVDAQTGESAGWFGASAPSAALLPPTAGSFTIGIEPTAIQAGHTIRASWLLAPLSPSGAAWPRIEAAYVHLDRFMLVGMVGCGGTVLGHAVPLPDPATQAQPLSFP